MTGSVIVRKSWQGTPNIYIYKGTGEDVQVAGIKGSDAEMILGNFRSILACGLMLMFCPIRQNMSLACL
jgi:hypothetical protein